MLSSVCFTAIFALIIVSVTGKRVLVICGFYSFYALLAVIDPATVPSLGPITIYRALYAIVLLSLVARFIQDATFPRQLRHLPIWQYAVLVFFVLASALYSQEHQIFTSDYNIWAVLVVMALFAFSAFHVQNDGDLMAFAVTTAAVSFVLSIWLIWNLARLNFEAYRGGTEANANDVSLFVLAGALPLLGFLFSARRWFSRFLCVAGLLCIVVAGLILASRGALAAFVVGAVIVVAGLHRKRGRMVLWASGALLLVMLLIALLLPQSGNILARFHEGDLGTLDNRTLVWSASLRYFLDSSLPRMIAGQGLASGSFILGPALVADLTNYHNTYLKFLMEQGLLGLFAFVIFLASLIQSVVRTQHARKSLMAGWIAYLLIAGLSGTVADAHFFWIILGVSAGACAQERLRQNYGEAGRLTALAFPKQAS